jgi:predicted HTH transcriptional regulator
LEFVILKSVAAFANAKGGILFIGVSDDLKILGLEKDFSTLKKQDADYFELHSRKLINNQYGIAFSNENILMEFHIFDNKTICSIQIKASENPVFLKSKNKQGQEIEKFYVRSGNASQEINSLKEVNEYIKIRFT